MNNQETNNTQVDNIEDTFIYRKGTKYYKINNGVVTIIRIVNIKNINTLVCMLDNFYHGADSIKNNKTFTMTPEELKKDYKLLLPHGQICMVNVKSTHDDVHDVLLAATKIEATSATAAGINFGEVYTICRQCIVDFFGLVINANEQCFGITVSRKTCPHAIRFDDLYKDCEPIERGQFINIYQQDDIDQIMGLFKTTKANSLLSNLYNSFDDKSRPKGIVKTVEALVKENGFINDIMSMFDIIPMPNVTINYENNIYVLKDIDIYQIEYALKCRIKDILVMEYSHFIAEEDLSEDYKHIKICDSTGKVYIIQFTPIPGFAEDLYPDSVKEGMGILLDKYKHDI